MKQFLLPVLFALISVLFNACATSQVFISVQEPSPVNLSPNTKRLGIINRSTLSDQNKKLNNLHKVLNVTADDILKNGAEECIAGLKNGLLESKRFDEIIEIKDPVFKSTVLGGMSPQINWEEIEKICKKNNLDALFVLELYDNDAKITSPALNPVNVLNPDVALQQLTQVTFTTIIKTAWRIYIPYNRIILDEYAMQAPLSYTFSGINPGLAEAILQRKQFIMKESNRLGADYSVRVLPYWIRVVRDYYIKPKKSFAVATRRSRTGNWDGAEEIWFKETKSSSRKVAGRACYNMAIISEINGDLDKGIDWAKKAYEDYNVKLARDYVRILKDRKNRNALLQKQSGQ